MPRNWVSFVFGRYVSEIRCLLSNFLLITASAAAQRGQQGQNSGSQKTTSSSPSRTSGTSATTTTTGQALSGSAQGRAAAPTGFTVKAMYDYTAADKDEVMINALNSAALSLFIPLMFVV